MVETLSKPRKRITVSFDFHDKLVLVVFWCIINHPKTLQLQTTVTSSFTISESGFCTEHRGKVSSLFLETWSFHWEDGRWLISERQASLGPQLGCPLETPRGASPCGCLSFLIGCWLHSKMESPKTIRWKPYHSFWLCLGNLTSPPSP